MTGQRSVQVNGKPADSPSPLNINDELALSPGGPFFRFLGGGRLLEITKTGTDSSYRKYKNT
jgi:hypothetical protein